MTKKRPSNTHWAFVEADNEVGYKEVLRVREVPSLSPDTERGFLFLERLKLSRQLFLASFTGSLASGLLALVVLLFLTGCSAMPEVTAVVKDGSILICVDNKCYKVGTTESTAEDTSP